MKKNIEKLYDKLYVACTEGDEKSFKSIMNTAKSSNPQLDLTYNEGLLGVVAAQKGNTKILKALVEDSSTLLVKHGTEILGEAAQNGHNDCVKFLLSKDIDPFPLKKTTAYNNYPSIEKLFNEYLQSRGVSEESSELSGDHLYMDEAII